MRLFEHEGCETRRKPAALLATRFFKGDSTSRTDTNINNNQVAAQSGGVAVGAYAGAINLSIANTTTSRRNVSARRSNVPTVNTSGAAPGYVITNTTNDPATAIAAINGNLAVINAAAGVVNNLVSQTISAFTDRPATVVTGAPSDSPAATDVTNGNVTTTLAGGLTRGEWIAVLGIGVTIALGVGIALKKP